MTHLISVKKNELSKSKSKGKVKLYPTVNLLCPISLKTWENLRKILTDYGGHSMGILTSHTSLTIIINAILSLFCLVSAVFNVSINIGELN